MSARQSESFYAGTSNVVLPVPNKQAFPPAYQDKSRLAYYASSFNSVEVNSTFYKLPMGKTVAKWAADVPDNFRFTFKLWQEITHQKSLRFDLVQVKRFMEVIASALPKNGCLLVQLPPGTTLNIAQLDGLLHAIQTHNPAQAWQIAVEFRHRSWYQDEVYKLLDNYNAGMVLHDLPASAAPVHEGNTHFIYLRFHGPQGGYRGSYDDDFLYEYAGYIKEWLHDGKQVYAYFNNTMGAAVKNLQTLNGMVKNIVNEAG